jgi:hypothetical protein
VDGELKHLGRRFIDFHVEKRLKTVEFFEKMAGI